MHSTALNKVTALLESEPAELDTRNGYLDLLGESPPEHRTLALGAMRSKALPVIYERWWRPVVRLANGRRGPDQAGERRLARELLGLHSGQTVLDVACGPGNFTRSYGAAVGPSGLVVGLDESPTMLGRAVGDTDAEQVAYVRGDARRLPFASGSFDAVGCFLALHLIPEPFRALAEMIRMVAPGGRIAISAPYLPSGPLPRLIDRAVNAPLGIKTFGRTEFTEVFERAGLVEVTQHVTGLFQFVGAVRPL